MDAFASLISNNQNLVIKFLTTITIVLSIPTMISNLFSMNVTGIPLATYKYGFEVICGISLVSVIIVALLLYKKDIHF